MRIFMAPMEGVVDHQLRRIYAAIGGIDCCVTEFVRVTQSRLPEKVFKRYCPELMSPIAIPVRVQLLGSDPGFLAFNARKAVKMGAPAIDLNFGCPAKTVNKNRGGACLLEEPELLFDIVRSVRQQVPPHIPVTAKIRLGYRARERYVENAKAISEAGASELFVHARSKTDGYAPPAYWSCIGEIRQSLTIPVIANGEIWGIDDYRQCKQQSLCEDFMLGRGLLAKPDLALAIKAYEAGQPHKDLTWEELLPTLHQFHLQSMENYPARFCGNRLKQWLMYLQKHYPQAKSLFMAIKRTRDPADIERAMQLQQA